MKIDEEKGTGEGCTSQYNNITTTKTIIKLWLVQWFWQIFGRDEKGYAEADGDADTEGEDYGNDDVAMFEVQGCVCCVKIDNYDLSAIVNGCVGDTMSNW